MNHLTYRLAVQATLAALLAAATATAAAAAGDDDPLAAPGGLAGGHVHEHDAAQLDIARDGGRVVLRFRAAAQAVVGFERAPRTEDERAALAVAAATLGRASPSFRWPSAAKCKVVGTTLEVPVTAKVQGDDHDHDHGAGEEHDHAGEEHADYAATWTVDCAVPAALTAVYVDLARHLQPRVKLRVNVASDTGQAQLEWAAPATERVPLQ